MVDANEEQDEWVKVDIPMPPRAKAGSPRQAIMSDLMDEPTRTACGIVNWALIIFVMFSLIQLVGIIARWVWEADQWLAGHNQSEIIVCYDSL